MGLTQIYYAYIKSGIYSDKIFNGQAVKSFGGEAKLSGGWLNDVDRNYGGRFAPWYLLFNGWNSVWWWHATFLHPANGACKWNLQLTPIVASVAESVAEIKKGSAALLGHAEKQIDAIAVHYSANNWHASTIESGIGNHINNLGLKYELWMADNLSNYLVGDAEMKRIWGNVKPKGHYAAASKNIYLLLHDLGFQPRTIARQEIEADILDSSKIKVLILPFVVSLSDVEAERIKSFVEQGGLLIADYRCGLRDMHGRMRSKGVLDDVFGIKRDSPSVIRKREIVTADNKWKSGGAKFEVIFHEPIKAITADVLGYNDDGTGAVFVNKFGKGKAVYLSFDLYCYDEMRNRGCERDIREYFRSLLGQFALILFRNINTDIR